jgi:hypothetical protein
LLGVLLTVTGFVYQTSVSFPNPDDIFITSGDGDIQAPYTPVGEFLYIEEGFRLGLPLLGLLPIKDVDPEVVLRSTIVQEVRRMGGDALINMRVNWTPPSSGFLGIFANGGNLAITGTVIRR